MGVEKGSPALREARDSPIPSSSSGDYAPPAWPSSGSSVSTNLALSASRIHRQTRASLEFGGAFAGRPAWNRWIRGARRVFRCPSKLHGRRKRLAGPSGSARFADTFVVLRRLCASRAGPKSRSGLRTRVFRSISPSRTLEEVAPHLRFRSVISKRIPRGRLAGHRLRMRSLAQAARVDPSVAKHGGARSADSGARARSRPIQATSPLATNLSVEARGRASEDRALFRL